MKQISPYRILMFATESFPPIAPEAIVTSKLIMAMHKAGWDIHVVTSQAKESYSRYPYSRDPFWLPITKNLFPIYAPLM
jgi:hypothetical protein